MKNISAFALLVAATFITAGSASAQGTAEKATVPFNFTVGNRTLPAGTYTIRSAATSPDVLVLSNPEKKIYMMTTGLREQNNPHRVNNLEFRQYGNKYFLREIRSEDASMNIHFAATKAEKSARAQTEEAQQHVDDPIMIALK